MPTISAEIASEVACKYAGHMKQINNYEVEEYMFRHKGSDNLMYAVHLEQLNMIGRLKILLFFVDTHTSNIIWTYENLKLFALSDADKITYDHDTHQVGESFNADLMKLHGRVE